MTANKIKQFLKQAFCKHIDADLLRWHWTHGPNGNEPAFIEAEYRCRECGKTVYINQYGRDARDWVKAFGVHKQNTL